MQGFHPCNFHMEENLKIDQSTDSLHVDASQYKRLKGRLLYLQATKPGIAYSINILGQFCFRPKAKTHGRIKHNFTLLKVHTRSRHISSKEWRDESCHLLWCTATLFVSELILKKFVLCTYISHIKLLTYLQRNWDHNIFVSC